MSRAQAPEQARHPQHDLLPHIRCIMWGAPYVGRTHAVARLGAGIYFQDHPHTEFDEFERYRTSTLTGVTARVSWRDLRQDCKQYDWFAQDFRNANVLVIMFSITDRRSFEDVPTTLEMINEMAPTGKPVFVVGTKSDLRVNPDAIHRLAKRGERCVDDSEAEEMCGRLGLAYFPLSNLDGTGADAIVDEIIRLGVAPPPNSSKTNTGLWQRLKRFFRRASSD